MLTLMEIVILAIVQGITEWLPISSFGHLALVEGYLGLELPLSFNLMLHVGSVFVVLAVFWRDIQRIVFAVLRLDFKTHDGKIGVLIVVGSIPTALIGLLLYDAIESFSHNLLFVGIAFLITGVILFFSERRKSNRELNYFDSLLIGTAQGVALAPGISRSGFTIATGLLRQIKKGEVFRYSFLLFLPAVIGATLLEARNFVVGDIGGVELFLGAAISMIVGFIVLKLLQKIVIREKFHLFAYYCWIIGFLTVITQLLR